MPTAPCVTAGSPARRQRAVVDQAAAVLILQAALDTERSTGAPPGSGSDQDGASHGRRTRGRDPARPRPRRSSGSPRAAEPRRRRDAPAPQAPHRGRRALARPALAVVARRRRRLRRRQRAHAHGRRRCSAAAAPRPRTSPAPGRARSTVVVEPGRDRRGHRHHPARRGRRQDAQRPTSTPPPRDPERARRDPARHLHAAQGDEGRATRSPCSPTPPTATSPGPRSARGCGPARSSRCCRKAHRGPGRGVRQAAAKDPEAIGLPERGRGPASRAGCFPSTYEFPTRPPPQQQLKAMVAQTVKELDDGRRRPRRTASGSSPSPRSSRPRSTVDADRAKVARVILNRLETDGAPDLRAAPVRLDGPLRRAEARRAGPTEAEPTTPTAPTTPACIPGLPPGPINNPGAASIEAAANPADGPWFFFVAVNPITGETKFAATLAEHDANVRELNACCTAKPQGLRCSEGRRPRARPSRTRSHPRCTARGTPRSG